MYDRIQRYRNEDHRSVSWIAQKLHLNRRTVKRYLAMSQAEYAIWMLPKNVRFCLSPTLSLSSTA